MYLLIKPWLIKYAITSTWKHLWYNFNWLLEIAGGSSLVFSLKFSFIPILVPSFKGLYKGNNNNNDNDNWHLYNIYYDLRTVLTTLIILFYLT